MGKVYLYRCAACGHVNSDGFGRWCWRCYQRVVGERRRAPRPNQADREERIRRYMDIADRGEPLFG